MHLKSYPKLVRSEVRLDAPGAPTASQRSSLFVSQQGGLLRTCSGNHGNVSSSRLPFSVISTNTLRRANATSSSVTSLRLKAPSVATLQLLPPTPGCENNTPGLYQTTAEDADAPLDIWAVIKPGHVREKIAIFASEEGRPDGAQASERTSTGSSGNRDRAPAVYTNHAAMTGLSRAVKAKGSWEENSSAKRRRRSGNNQNLQQDQTTRVQDTQQLTLKVPLSSDATQQSSGGRREGEPVPAEEEEQKVSVVEIVAFMEQRANEQQPDSKPLLALQRSSTTITLSRAPPSAVKDGSEVRGEEPESVKVSDMVARLESECLRRRTEGDLSRSNSLRRTVGRVLLAAADQSPAPCQPSSPTSPTSPTSPGVPLSSSSPLSAAPSREPVSCLQTIRVEMPASALTTPSSPVLTTPPTGELVGESQQVRGAVTETAAPPPSHVEAEPVPGLLFLAPPSAETNSEPRLPAICPSPSDSPSQSEKRRRRKTDRAQTDEAVGVASPLSRRASASQDFLVMRQRLQQLLEPQPYLAVLPHHLLVKIFLLLPTQSLAALKCSCHYFKFIIENYGVRPADSLWVSDPRYRDDPCKQCKRRYGRGDVSLCRWHHKPYCQALPYGPGYWMCCHGAHRDAPGCNVGLHDNRWVPAFHSINVPIYRRSRNHDD
ncbi:F-box only protein 34 [Stegastes partitus]|uniref:F-box only protein 34 n=1 Tax=Stegastes partitus TaxID=144197 RepID=A0A9Y4JQW4_9TELE|nr:PREDICTED: F-box only protein 34 [Stegastes partitus]XP_008275315.1 PREDICTED: F-box only protein 34 [Stegastes partitus]XP_008275316.1 PREDICTED: F-box only protein 34 [Stegastes partitus]